MPRRVDEVRPHLGWYKKGLAVLVDHDPTLGGVGGVRLCGWVRHGWVGDHDAVRLALVGG